MTSLGPVNGEVIARHEQRRKKWEALNMIPMRVSKQYRGGDRALGIRDQMVAQQPRAGAAIHDEVRARVAGQLDAGSVATAMICPWAGRCDRSSGTPKAQAHSMLSRSPVYANVLVSGYRTT